MKNTIKFILITTFASKTFAGIGDDLEKFFNKKDIVLGTMSNVTMPGAHKDQSGGYYTDNVREVGYLYEIELKTNK